jgi:hypothetical protein
LRTRRPPGGAAILGLEIVLLVLGILALVRGRMPFLRNKVVVGAPARLLGLLALSPIPLSLLGIILYAGVPGSANEKEVTNEVLRTVFAIEAGTVITVAVLAFGIAAAVAVTPEEDAEGCELEASPEDSDDEADDRGGGPALR